MARSQRDSVSWRTVLAQARGADADERVGRIVGGGEKGYQNGGEVVPSQESRSE
jgi:hypothetical protein